MSMAIQNILNSLGDVSGGNTDISLSDLAQNSLAIDGPIGKLLEMFAQMFDLLGDGGGDHIRQGFADARNQLETIGDGVALSEIDKFLDPQQGTAPAPSAATPDPQPSTAPQPGTSPTMGV